MLFKQERGNTIFQAWKVKLWNATKQKPAEPGLNPRPADLSHSSESIARLHDPDP